MGLSYLTHLTFGNIVIISGLVIITIDFALKEKIGFGSIINAILIGKFVDLIQFVDIIPQMSNLWFGIPMLLAGQIFMCIGCVFYISASLGCGPRDAFMVALGKRFSRVPIGAIRGIIEGTVLLIGWLLGAKVGVGTVISVFGIGFIMQYTFQMMRFDVKGVQHENVMDTIKAIRNWFIKNPAAYNLEDDSCYIKQEIST